MPDVLIVDDDAQVGRTHGRILERAGFAVTAAENGLAALAELQQHSFQVILLDVQMPFLEGSAFYDELARLYPGLRRRVIFVTGHAGDTKVQKFLRDTGRPILTKPVEAAALVAAVRQAADQAPPPTRLVRPARVLVVDDDPAVRKTVRRHLTAAGCEVLEAADGRIALKVLEEQQVDLLITDMYMPGVDGVELAIRTRQAERPVPMIGISGGGYMDQSDVLELARSMGVARTLPKPFDGEELLAAVNDVLSQER